MEDAMEKIKNVALVAHDNRKKDLIEWVEWNFEVLLAHNLVCTGTTGKLVEKVINKKLASTRGEKSALKKITLLKSGPWAAINNWAR